MLGVQKTTDVHYTQSAGIQDFPVNRCGRWFLALGHMPLSLAGSAAILLDPVGPHG